MGKVLPITMELLEDLRACSPSRDEFRGVFGYSMTPTMAMIPKARRAGIWPYWLINALTRRGDVWNSYGVDRNTRRKFMRAQDTGQKALYKKWYDADFKLRQIMYGPNCLWLSDARIRGLHKRLYALRNKYELEIYRLFVRLWRTHMRAP
jgi:hypothetical protein